MQRHTCTCALGIGRRAYAFYVLVDDLFGLFRNHNSRKTTFLGFFRYKTNECGDKSKSQILAGFKFVYPGNIPLMRYRQITTLREQRYKDIATYMHMRSRYWQMTCLARFGVTTQRKHKCSLIIKQKDMDINLKCKFLSV